MKDGGPAFCGAFDVVLGEDNGKGALHKIEARSKGISLRDYFAAAVDVPWAQARAIAAEQLRRNPTTQEVINCRASLRGAEADAMLSERDK